MGFDGWNVEFFVFLHEKNRRNIVSRGRCFRHGSGLQLGDTIPSIVRNRWDGTVLGGERMPPSYLI